MSYSSANLQLDGETFPLPLVEGSDGTQALDITQLFEKSGVATFDQNLRNTAVARSAVTWIDAANGKLLYRGYDVGELVEKSSFVETAYLLSNGELPSADELKEYSTSLSKHSMIHESMRNFFDAFPGDAHPIANLSVMVTALSSYYPATYEENIDKGIDIKARLLAKMRTLAAWSYKKSVGQPIVYPRDNLPYCANLLNMMFAVPAEPYTVPRSHDAILNKILILYADHEQNVATSTVRLVGSTHTNLFASVSAGMCAFWGARESSAVNVPPPMRMLEQMLDNRQAPEQYFEKFINGEEPMTSTGLGHTSYKTTDPRAVICGKLFHDYLDAHPEFKNDPRVQKALEVEEFTRGHGFFVERRLYPNLDFYSGLIFHMIGMPIVMNNVLRVIGKLAGWLAHWQEQRTRNDRLALRPRQVYFGESERSYVDVDAR